MNTVFMGTPDFALPCLKRLVEKGYNVSGVFTQPDKPVGRKQIITPPPVKQYALEQGIPVFQPEKIKTGECFELIKKLSPDVIVVVAYGKIIPENIIDFPKYGCINIHGSLLPRLRGAAPIQWSVINGDKYAGITSMKMDAGLDTGDIILKRPVEIGFCETSGELYDRLSLTGADVMEETLKLLEEGKATFEKQDDSLSTYAPLLSKEISEINWNEDGLKVYNKIRGLNPWPVAHTFYSGKKIKIISADFIENIGKKAGEITADGKSLTVSCGDGSGISVKVIQSEGKKAMDIKSFLAGNKIESGSFFGG